MHPKIAAVIPLLGLLTLAACSKDRTTDRDPDLGLTAGDRSTLPLFTAIPPSASGIDFMNEVVETNQQNYFIYEYIYNGGGVGVGDVNNDGLPDLYITGNLVPDKLYLNKGDLKFEDVTDKAITSGADGWHSGVTMADVNADGWLDIYVCRAGWYTDDPDLRRNLLYINNGDLTFTERAKEWGVADTTRSTQASFFDYDKDGDLDLYVINTPLQTKVKLSNVAIAKLIKDKRTPTNRLYRNDGGHFTDVTDAAGIRNMGYGLGLSTSDWDQDGWQDMYVAIDYIEKDMLLRNEQGSGRFNDEMEQRLRHISNFGMGCDIADYNNDGLVDIVVMDMVSEDHVRSKKNMGGMSSEKFWQYVRAGYHYQFMFNTLQLNNGNGTFSEVAQLAGISKTDWSWAPLFADLDNDGWKDLFVTNGYKRDMRDNDYAARARDISNKNTPVTFDQVLKLVPSTRIKNYMFRNKGDLTFENVSSAWGIDHASNSNGAAYADLDRDGDLDLLVSNLDEPFELFRNEAMERGLGHYLQIQLEGADQALGQGGKVTIHTSNGIQFQEVLTTRGYQSCVEPLLHFGLGNLQVVERVEVIWPDGQRSELEQVAADQLLRIEKSTAKPYSEPAPADTWLAERSEQLGLAHRHVEKPYDDFAQEVLIPHKLSEQGPLLCAGDVNGDGLEDLYIGGTRGSSGRLMIQRPNGSFGPSASAPWSVHKAHEDIGSMLFDADGDGDQDLYVVSGSNEVDLYFDQYADRLYLNDGKGSFTYSASAIPNMTTSGSRIAVADIDADGDMDIFKGGRVVPGQYPKPPRSYLLLNDGKGRFTDATSDLGPQLMEPGLVTDAEFTDKDGDGDMDLVIVGEWMPIMVMENRGDGTFERNEQAVPINSEGWWWSLSKGDVDGDGDEDLVAGNLGWNSKFHATEGHPLHVFWDDLDNNGKPDIVLAKEGDNKLLPVRGRECSSQQCPMILDKFPTYDAFAKASLEDIYTPEKIRKALHLKAHRMLSTVLINDGKGNYTMQDLPMMAQIAPVNASQIMDINKDGNQDIIIAGNFWGAEVETVRYDAGNGLILLGDGNGGFTPVPIPVSGFFADKDAKDMVVLNAGTDPIIVVSNNNGPLQAFKQGAGSTLIGALR